MYCTVPCIGNNKHQLHNKPPQQYHKEAETEKERLRGTEKQRDKERRIERQRKRDIRIERQRKRTGATYQ